jgi:hypothetical protein
LVAARLAQVQSADEHFIPRSHVPALTGMGSNFLIVIRLENPLSIASEEAHTAVSDILG